MRRTVTMAWQARPQSLVQTGRQSAPVGSTDLVIGRYMAGITTGVDIICGHCNWQGMIQPGIW